MTHEYISVTVPNDVTKKRHVVSRGFATQKLCFGYYQVSTLNPFARENRVRSLGRLMTTPTQNHVTFLNFEKH